MTATTELGVQLYSVRDDLGDALPNTLQRLAGMGFTHVEPYDILSDTDGLKSAMDGAGLLARTCHSKIHELDRDDVISAARTLGIDTVIIPWVQPDSIADFDGVRDLALRINEAAAYAADYGIRLGYHNHDFEFAQKIGDQPAYELLVSLLHEDVVLEVDTYWASVGGADVFELLPRLRDRVRFLHVKNQPADPGDRPARIDITGRMGEILDLTRDFVELPVVEVVVHEGDVFPSLERNAEYFLSELSGVQS
jgi:sugar phosphate isomerase/epimerase